MSLMLPYAKLPTRSGEEPRKVLLILLLSLLLPVVAGAGEDDRPRVGLVLSGGGARGAAHVGVLKVIDELHIPIDVIAGTSMGSIIGGLYASGMTAEEIEKALAAVDWSDVLQDDTIRTELSFRRKEQDRDFVKRTGIGVRDGKIKLPYGLLQGQKLLLLLKKLTRPVSGVGDFDRLAIPFRAVATDIVTGDAVVLGKGDLALAMRASASIPSIFSAVEIDGKLLVDGGVSNNRCPPWRAKRRRVVPGSREATRDTRRAEGAKGDPKGASERGVQSYGRPVCSRNELAMLWRNAG